MKRSASDQPSPRKRFASRFTPSDFPDIEGKSLFEIDFTSYARTHPSDLIITNGSAEFETHKRIIQACSGVLNDILQGDASTKEVTVTDIPDNALELFYNLLYDTPKERKTRLSAKMCEDGSKHTDFVRTCMRFDMKYDCKMMHEWLLFDSKIYNYLAFGDCFHFVYDSAIEFQLLDVAKVIENNHIHNRTHDETNLTDFKPQMVQKMIKAHNFQTHFGFFDKVLKYANMYGNEQIWQAVDEISIAGNAWKQKYLLEKKKSQALSKFLQEEKRRFLLDFSDL